jgi:dGTPase
MAQKVNFRERILPLRPGDDPATAASVDLLHAFESDRGRIIHSAAVRRLQQRTQVFPLERNAAVRSRLTHSMEVQQTGRFIVRTLYAQLGGRAAEYGLEGLQPALETLVEMTCLMHDIGNPPFGHFGEFAIGEWFGACLPGLFAPLLAAGGDARLGEQLCADLRHFEGNAQALRLVVNLQRLRLTYSQSAGLLKYLRPAYQPRPAEGADNAYRYKKAGFYWSEQAFVGQLQRALAQQPGTRHPLAYIMEAADDISYCLADIEDSVEKGILAVEELRQLLLDSFARHQPVDAPIPGAKQSFAELLEQAFTVYEHEPINKAGEFFVRLRVSMIHPLVQHAARQFIDNIEAIFQGTLDRALIEDQSLPHAMVQSFKDVAMARVFCHPEVETLQLQGHRILQGLLDVYGQLLRVDAARFLQLTEGTCRAEAYLQMLVRRLPNQLLKAYRQAPQAPDASQAPLWERYYRCRLIQDFISGMTDQQAQDEYRILSAL